MGWDFTYGAERKDIIESLTKPWDREDRQTHTEVIDKAVCANVLWTVRRITKNGQEITRYIGCDLLRKSKDGWGYKAMDESVHPFYYSCPLRFLDLAPVVCEEWRAKVREYHTQRSRKLLIGQKIKLINCRQVEEVTIVNLRPLRGKDCNGNIWRIPKKLIGEVCGSLPVS